MTTDSGGSRPTTARLSKVSIKELRQHWKDLYGEALSGRIGRLSGGPLEVWDHVFLHKLHAPEHFVMVETTQTRPAQNLG
jgi:hypothetical protein